ncbi:MAG TPA: hypothetical protein VGL58_19765, partial [Caulobacteraceae bacterium]
MRPELRFSLLPPDAAPELRWVERANELAEALAPTHWTTARVEAWLDWADTLPSDMPADAPASLSLAHADPLLHAGPDRYARRLAAWGLALGALDDEDAALAFRAELFAALTTGVIATGAQLPFGARVHPIAGDTAAPPPTTTPKIGSREFAAAATLLRGGRGLAA